MLTIGQHYNIIVAKQEEVGMPLSAKQMVKLLKKKRF